MTRSAARQEEAPAPPDGDPDRGTGRRLVLVDDMLSARNPSTAPLVLALPELRKLGWELEFWGDRLDEDLRDSVTHRWVPALKKRWLPPVVSMTARNLAGGLRLLGSGARRSDTVFLTTGGRFLFADILWFHFYNHGWFRRQSAGIEWGPESPLRRFTSLWGCGVDTLALNCPVPRRILPVSDAIADQIRDDFPGQDVRTLPNCVDAGRFDSGLRRARGSELRGEFGFREDETILLFVSQGHFARKGFWLAIKAVREARRRTGDPYRLVVLGGRGRTLDRIRKHLASLDPDWADWLTLVGWTDRVPEYMAAADALFFPSYFEAFSLVEIEAAAMGLPLVLTRHPGSEMILEEGVNGFLSGFELDELVAVLGKVRNSPPVITRPSIGRALTPARWALELQAHLEDVLRAKKEDLLS